MSTAKNNIVGVVYIIINKTNGKPYIGQTIQKLEKRWRFHVWYANYYSGKKQTKLGRAIKKYGKDNFIIETLYKGVCLNEREIFFISLYNSVLSGYNIKGGGDGGAHSDSTKKKIAKANTKRIWTDEMCETMSVAIKKWHKDRGFVPRSDETKRKISQANRRRTLPDKARQAFKKHNDSTKKSVVCLTNGKEYDSINQACRELGLNNGQLSQHLKGIGKSVKGLIFEYKKQPEKNLR